jgi:murein DD-endopeptidase MepM/ murein hydrolase activator NlpD
MLRIIFIISSLLLMKFSAVANQGKSGTSKKHRVHKSKSRKPHLPVGYKRSINRGKTIKINRFYNKSESMKINSRRGLNHVLYHQEKKHLLLTATDSVIYEKTVSFEKTKGNLPWPVNGQVQMGFGRQKVSDTGKLVCINPGISIKTSDVENVKAVFEGEVTYLANVGPAKMVTIRHGNYLTTYSNLKMVNVVVGQKIQQGDLIGDVMFLDDQYVLDFIISDTTSRQFNPIHWLLKP